MNKPLLLLSAFLFAALSSAAVFADDSAVYKWTDAQGVVHYSDKPPKEGAADLQTLDLPPLPPQDPAKIAAEQAALAASTAALMQQQQTQAALQQQQLALALQQAQLQATLAALQQPQADEVQVAPIYAINAGSRFIPRSFRRNLYVPHHFVTHTPVSVDHPVFARPSMPSHP